MATFDDLVEISEKSVGAIFRDNIIGACVRDVLGEQFEEKQEVLDDIENYEECTVIGDVSEMIEERQQQGCKVNYYWDRTRDQQILYQILQKIFEDNILNIQTLKNHFHVKPSKKKNESPPSAIPSTLIECNTAHLLQLLMQIANEINKNAKKPIDINKLQQFVTAHQLNGISLNEMEFKEFSGKIKKYKIAAGKARQLYNGVKDYYIELNKPPPDYTDLSICEQQDNEYKCEQDCDDPIEGCIAVKRLVVTLLFYTGLDIENNKDDQDKFAQFMNEVYTLSLDDYGHLIREHNNLEAIHEAVKKIELFPVCNPTECAFTARHQSREFIRARSTLLNAKFLKISQLDNNLKFHSQNMDALHFYLMHLFECGLRSKTDVTDYKHDSDADDKYFDKRVSRISRQINEKRRIRPSFNRFKNNKFNITTTKDRDGEAGTVFIDELIRSLISDDVNEIAIRKFAQFVRSHDYDSDAVKEDIKNGTMIATVVADKKAKECIAAFVVGSQLQSSSFNIGLIFYYWPAYEAMYSFDQNTNHSNINDHGGYPVKHLFVKQKHESFKEEVSHYRFIDMKAYEASMVKVREYLNTDRIKEMSAYCKSGRNNLNILLQYGIEHGAPLLERHLLALFLYTDFSALCTHFSATFRAIRRFETLSSIRRRNAKYWWMAKGLREVVELYGDTRITYDDIEDRYSYKDGLTGPFYSGVSVVMPFPEFEIRLCGPSSTSLQIEIAINFAGNDGLVVQLSNFVEHHEYLPGFGCDWLSDYAEEDEVLFMGGHYRVKIESVRILKGENGGCQNFENYNKALCKFNKMFNGGDLGDVTAWEAGLILDLIDWKLGKKDLSTISNEANEPPHPYNPDGKETAKLIQLNPQRQRNQVILRSQNDLIENSDTKGKIDKYLLDSFLAFCQHKKHIVFNYASLLSATNEYSMALITKLFYEDEELNKRPEFQTSSKAINIFRKEVFKLFTSVKSIDIYTTDSDGHSASQCILSCVALFSEVEREKWTQITIKAVRDVYSAVESWLSRIWGAQREDLKLVCAEKGYEIFYQNERNEKNFDVDCLVITKAMM